MHMYCVMSAERGTAPPQLDPSHIVLDCVLDASGKHI